MRRWRETNTHADDILSEKMIGRDDQLGMDHVNRKVNYNRGDSIFIR